jgi:myo-inositol 2-dehydrogenase/D-chiro-inositol 1-dehydrogenase
MPAKIRVGLLGAGNIGRFHAHTVAFKTPGAELVAISDVMGDAAGALAAATDAPRWGADPAIVLDDPAIDAVVIATPGPTHAELIARAAEAGKQIFCEKPIALELAEIDAALSAVERAGVKLQIGFQRRFDAGYLRAKELIAGGKIGDVQIVHSRTRDPDVPSLAYLRSCGGLFRDTSVHDLDSIRWLTGMEVTSVYATGAVLIDPIVGEAGDVDTAVITLRLTNGAIATVDNSRRAVYGYDVRAEVFGSAGSVEVARPGITDAVYRSSAGIGQEHVFRFLDLFKDAYEEEIRSFIHCVRTDTAPRVTGHDGRMATLLGLAAGESLRTGAEVRL